MGFGKKLAAGAAIGIAGFAAGVASSTFVRKLYNDLLDHLEKKIDGNLKLFDLEADGSEDFVDQMLSDLNEKRAAKDQLEHPKHSSANKEDSDNATPEFSISTATGVPSCFGSPSCGVHCDCSHRRYHSINFKSPSSASPVGAIGERYCCTISNRGDNKTTTTAEKNA